MDGTYPQALFSTAGSLSALVAVLVIEALSLLVLAVVCLEERVVARKQDDLLRALGGGSVPSRRERSRLFVWTYVLLTLSAAAVTVLLFLFQPHLL